MTCPKCQSPMENVQYQTIEVERCTGCKGLWFDMLEQDDLKTLQGSEQIDIGAAAQGQAAPKTTPIQCPSCSAQMIAMVDRQQPHIGYESCSRCYGVFFDAGEFKDFKEQSVLESFKHWYSKSRV